MLSFKEYNEVNTVVTYEEYCDFLDGHLTEKVTLTRTLQDLKNHIMSIANDFKMSYTEIVNAFQEKSVFALLKAFGFSLKKMASATYKSITSLNQLLMSIVSQMSETGDLKKLEKGSMTADQLLSKYPSLKRVTGPMVAGFLVYQWMNMSFSGDFKQDFDVSNILDALRGQYAIEDVLASPLGFKSMIQLMTGLSLGLSFPWNVLVPANLFLAFLFTAALKSKDKNIKVVAKKAIEKSAPRGGGALTTKYL